jgi:hypothetical protein
MSFRISRNKRHLLRYLPPVIVLACLVMLRADTQLRSAYRPQLSPTIHQELVTNDNVHAYTMNVGGLLDPSNTLRREYGNIHYYQPNISLKIENLGRSAVKNPRIVVNVRRDWGTLESILAEVISPEMTEKEKAIAIWRFVQENSYHHDPAEGLDETHDPVRYLNVYGYGICDDSSAVLSAMWTTAGLQVRSWNLGGHVVSEVWYDGAYHILDTDAEVIYPLGDNLTLAGYDDLLADPYWAVRTHHYGPYAPKDLAADAAHAALYGDNDVQIERNVHGYRMDMVLRPGESFEWRWDNIGKYHENLIHGEPPPFYANGKWTYTPDLSMDDYRGYLAREENIKTASEDGGFPRLHLDQPGETGRAIFMVQSPYVIVGGTVRAEVVLSQQGDTVNIRAYGEDYEGTNVWTSAETGIHMVTFSLDEFIAPLASDAKYIYFLEVELESDSGTGVGLNYLSIETDVQMAPLSLPALSQGKNEVVYSDDNLNPHQVLITHEWREETSIHPPQSLMGPVYPAVEGRADISNLRFEWQPAVDAHGNDVAAYHFFLSGQPDSLIPLSSNFERVVPGSTYELPWDDLLTPGQRYYWRVRSLDKNGVWSAWSDIWTFTAR